MTVRRSGRYHPVTLRARGASLPRVVEPMLPERTAEPFDSTAHIFEVLWDGIRALVFVEDGKARMQDCFGRDITRRFPELQGIASRVRDPGVVIDGVIVCLDEDGHPAFQRLQPRLGLDEPSRIAQLAATAPASFHAFDLLYRDYQPTMGWPLRRRKEMLRGTVRQSDEIAVPEYVTRDGVAFFEAARDHGLLGIVAKESDGRYLPGQRSPTWLSVRVFPRDEFVIVGYTFGARWDPHDPARRAKEPFSSLVLGAYCNDGRLSYVGEVTGGFPPDDMHNLLRKLDDLAVPFCPLADAPDLGRLVFWCRPELACTVRYAAWTGDRRLRFPVFEALRPDVPAESCVLPAEG